MSRANLGIGVIPEVNACDQFQVISVQIIDMTSMDTIKELWPQWVGATWATKPGEGEDTIKDITTKTFLPSVLDTVKITFLVSGIDAIDVTHLLRHRGFTFSAQCTADRNLSLDPMVIKPSIFYHDVFWERTEKLIKEAKQLYQDMIDSQEVSILDARTVLPKCTGTFYYVTGNLSDVIRFVQQRKDTQIQPESDNLVALYLWAEVLQRAPELDRLIDWDSPDWHYINSANQGTSTNIYAPCPKNAKHVNDGVPFLYNRPRNTFTSGHFYEVIEEQIRRKNGF